VFLTRVFAGALALFKHDSETSAALLAWVLACALVIVLIEPFWVLGRATIAVMVRKRTPAEEEARREAKLAKEERQKAKAAAAEANKSAEEAARLASAAAKAERRAAAEQAKAEQEAAILEQKAAALEREVAATDPSRLDNKVARNKVMPEG
jgi:hypothetical protein